MVYVFNPDNSSVYVMDIFISAPDIHEDMIIVIIHHLYSMMFL